MIKIISRYLNALYSFVSFFLARSLSFHIHPPLPPSVSVELSAKCNLHCPECVSGAGLLKRKNGFIDPLLAQKIADEISGHAVSAWLYFQGEPMMHPYFFEILEMFRGVKTVISTNGHYLTEMNCRKLAFSGLAKIIIPYDAVTEETYKIYRRGGDLKRVTEGIELLSDIIRRTRSTLIIEIQYVYGRHNEHEADAAARFAESVNATFRIKSMEVLDPERISHWVPTDIKKSRYKEADGKYTPLATHRRGCLRLWTTTVITADGDVLPCCYDKNGKYTMGNISDHRLREIWSGPDFRSFRQRVMKSRLSVDICSRCPQGSKLLF